MRAIRLLVAELLSENHQKEKKIQKWIVQMEGKMVSDRNKKNSVGEPIKGLLNDTKNRDGWLVVVELLAVKVRLFIKLSLKPSRKINSGGDVAQVKDYILFISNYMGTL